MCTRAQAAYWSLRGLKSEHATWPLTTTLHTHTRSHTPHSHTPHTPRHMTIDHTMPAEIATLLALLGERKVEIPHRNRHCGLQIPNTNTFNTLRPRGLSYLYYCLIMSTYCKENHWNTNSMNLDTTAKPNMSHHSIGILIRLDNLTRHAISHLGTTTQFSHNCPRDAQGRLCFLDGHIHLLGSSQVIIIQHPLQFNHNFLPVTQDCVYSVWTIFLV